LCLRVGNTAQRASCFSLRMSRKLYRADLHVHSQYSNRPSMWALRRFNCPESFTAPLTIYELAKKRGMDFVTITDHNSIEGAREILHLPGTFLSTELTAYFPENGCKVHVVVLGLTEQQFPELMVLRKNVYELVEFLRKKDVTHFLAHPLYDINGKLSLEMVEKFLLLFNTFEGRNGGRDRRFNDLFVQIASTLTSDAVDRLANKYGIEPFGPRPWVKGLTGGSDDHSGLYVGQTFSEVGGAPTAESFLEAVREAKTVPAGEHGGALTLAHSIYAVAYQFFSRKSGGRPLKSYPFLGALLDSMFGNGKGLSRSARLKLAISKALPEIYPPGNRSRRVEEVLDREIRQLLNDKVFREQLGAAAFNRRVFTAGSYLANRLLYHYTARLMAKKMDGGFMDLVNSLSTVGFVHLVTAPYYIAHRSQSKHKPLLRELERAFAVEAEPSPRKIALFSDTLSDVNGVALTIGRVTRAASAHGTDLVVIGCSNQPTGRTLSGMNFQAIGDFGVPEYPGMTLHFPPILDVIDFVDRENFDRVHVSTPGPQGLLGLLVGRLMGLPVTGTYHTDIPRYVGRLTADQSLEETAWNYIMWFYNQLDEVLIPSRSTRDQLLARGLSPEKARPLPRWVDTEMFTPELRDCSLWAAYGADQGPKLLYVGRVSREKNLELLVDAFMELQATGSSAWLVVAGDGPYREEMQRRLGQHKAIFTGFLSQADLARVYASADVLVFPSTTDTFGNVVLEAQASGLPVVVTDSGGPRELMVPGETGVVVAANDKKDLIRAMRILSEDHEHRTRMGLAAREFAVRGALPPSLQFATLFGGDVDWAWAEQQVEAVLTPDAV
jgi:glycosyltransferase involved in cell wall biosynthesis